MSDHSTAPQNSTLRCVVEGVADQDGEYQDDATVTLESLRERHTSSNVGGVTLPLAMNHIPGTDGNYEASIDAEADLVAGNWYRGVIRAELTAGQVREWTEDLLITRGSA